MMTRIARHYSEFTVVIRPSPESIIFTSLIVAPIAQPRKSGVIKSPIRLLYGRTDVFSGIKISPFEPTGGFETLPTPKK
jgi:hypothetical protein